MLPEMKEKFRELKEASWVVFLIALFLAIMETFLYNGTLPEDFMAMIYVCTFFVHVTLVFLSRDN